METEETVRCVHYASGCGWTSDVNALRAHVERCQYDFTACPNHCSKMLARINLSHHLKHSCARRKRVCSLCGIRCSVDEYESHLGSCKFENVWCENKCGIKLQRRHLDTHMASECVKREALCQHCRKKFVFETLETHYYNCPRYPLSCPNQCDLPSKVPREDLEEHVQERCPSATVHCRYHVVGCNFKGPRFSLNRHLENNMSDHLNMTYDLVSRQQKTIEDLTGHLQLGPTSPLSSSGCRSPATSGGNRLHKSVNGTSIGNNRHANGSHANGSHVNSSHTNGSHAINETHSANGCFSNGIHAKDSIASPSVCVCGGSDVGGGSAAFGQLCWRLNGFSEKLANARTGSGPPEIHSTPFYTSPCGYRLMATVFPNGNGSGEGKFLSLYIKVVRGAFDHVLDWPFPLKLTFTIYDQSPRRVRENIEESFLPDPSWKHFHNPSLAPPAIIPPRRGRQSKDGNDNEVLTLSPHALSPAPALGFGYPKFVSHAELRTKQYIRDDALILRIHVDNGVFAFS